MFRRQINHTPSFPSLSKETLKNSGLFSIIVHSLNGHGPHFSSDSYRKTRPTLLAVMILNLIDMSTGLAVGSATAGGYLPTDHI